jgi:uncharacterized membrane protein YsdA (DUF1294 family)/cold shock CspA family protein
MKRQGTVVKWEDARGFGFIRSAGTHAEIFFHVRDFRSTDGNAPRTGLAVTFEEIHVGGKGPRGMAVRPSEQGIAPAPTTPSRRRSPPSAPLPSSAARSPARSHDSESSGFGTFFMLVLTAIYAAVLVWGVYVGRLPWWVLPASLGINLFVFFVYWQDKWAASNRQWRTRESSLHLWSLMGGWLGAGFAQQVLRHKSRKLSFLGAYWVTAFLRCAAVAARLAKVT